MSINYDKGKLAVTHYRVLKRFRQFTHVECRLETGRTHQIRVHMASIHHPLWETPFMARLNVRFPVLKVRHSMQVSLDSFIPEQVFIWNFPPPFQITLKICLRL